MAQQAIAEGFLPDIISTDETTRSMYVSPTHSLPYVMSKYLALGMPFSDILRAATATPARLYGFDKAGTLEDGAWADIAVLRLEEKENTFRDSQGNTFRGSRLLVPQMTVKRGAIVYRQVDF
ncbi:Deacetylase [bioreactor metagenome]|uniref:Deacetylase n=1 Tax=bioreactor metagenome TaxID=1076179 RepID=A0A645HHZ2_9ZZZZ